MLLCSGSESEESKAVTYELPDGTALDLTADKFKIPELLFDPSPITVGGNELVQGREKYSLLML